MELKTEVIFRKFFEADDNMLGHFRMEKGYHIPLNICIDNMHEVEIQPDEVQSITIHSISREIEVYPTEEMYEKSVGAWAPISLIPIGTFPADDEDEEWEASAHILFSGKVLEVDYNSDAEPERPNYALLIETVDMMFILHTFRTTKSLKIMPSHA